MKTIIKFIAKKNKVIFLEIMTLLTALIIGLSYFIISVTGALIDLLVVFAIYRSGLLNKTESSFYILAAFTTFTSALRLINSAIYWAPSTALQVKIYEKEVGIADVS